MQIRPQSAANMYQSRCLPLLLPMAIGLCLLAGCGRDPAGGAGAGDAPATAASARAEGMDESQLRAAISAAIREQRLYAPAGDNAIEWYLILRTRVPKDAALATALLELEPYAVIAAEQSLARGEIDETRRLLSLIERANAEASALPRLRGQIARAVQAKAEAAAEQLALDQEAPPALSGAESVATGKVAIPQSQPMAAASPTVPPPAPQPAVLEAPRSQPVPPLADANAAAILTPAAIRMPNLLRDRAPRYPAKALSRKVEGHVELAFTIKGDGSVTDVRVLSATPQGFFEEAAMATSRFWQFEALGKDVSTSRTITFTLPRQAP